MTQSVDRGLVDQVREQLEAIQKRCEEAKSARCSGRYVEPVSCRITLTLTGQESDDYIEAVADWLMRIKAATRWSGDVPIWPPEIIEDGPIVAE